MNTKDSKNVSSPALLVLDYFIHPFRHLLWLGYNDGTHAALITNNELDFILP